MKAEYRNGCLQRDSVERKGYAGVQSVATRENKERDNATKKLVKAGYTCIKTWVHICTDNLLNVSRYIEIKYSLNLNLEMIDAIINIHNWYEPTNSNIFLARGMVILGI